MEMQLRDILIFPTVGNKTIAFLFQTELYDEALDGSEQFYHEVTVCWLELAEAADGAFGDE